MMDLKREYPDRNIIEVKDEAEIKKFLSSKSATSWGNAKINDKYYCIGQSSPSTPKDLPTVFVCNTQKAEQILKEIK